jgi:hypothetical protein
MVFLQKVMGFSTINMLYLTIFDRVLYNFAVIIEEGGMVMDKTIKNGYNAVIEALSGGGGGILMAPCKAFRLLH